MSYQFLGNDGLEQLLTKIKTEINKTAHTHNNKSNVLDKLTTDNNGKLYFNGEEITIGGLGDIGSVDDLKDLLDKKLEAENALDFDEIQTPEFIESANSLQDAVDEFGEDVAANTAEINTLKTKVQIIETNIGNIDLSEIESQIEDLQDYVDNMDLSENLSYYAKYEDSVFQLIEVNQGEETIVSQFTIVSGGGGGGSNISTTVTVDRITQSPYTATVNDRVIIEYSFSSVDSSGDPTDAGTATWKVGNTVVATSVALLGDNEFDITDYLNLGINKVTLSVEDIAGTVGVKTWSVQKVDLRIESDFNDAILYPVGTVSFTYVPYGAMDKTVHFLLDGTELTSVQTSVSGRQMTYILPSKPHGSHILDAYITATVNGTNITTNHIKKDILYCNSSSTVPLIGCVDSNITLKQYESYNIKYVCYDPTKELPEVSLIVDGTTIATRTLDSNSQIWKYQSDVVGSHVLKIKCGTTEKTINVTVEELDIDVSPITNNLVFDFNPAGKSNTDTNRNWSNNNITMSVSDNFDWVNGGYQIDENGDQYFCIKSGTYAIINYNLFADDAKRNGKEFKVVFKTTNVKKRDTSFLSCIDDGIGIDMKVETAYINSNNSNLYTPYCEDDIIEFEFNIYKDTDMPILMTFEDGVASRPMIYNSDSSFIQPNPKPIKLGSDNCDLHIYRMKAYSASLTDSDILSNYIADARNINEMLSRYYRNQIYNSDNSLTPDYLAEVLPDIRIIKIEAPHFTNDKKDFVKNTSMQCIYKNGTSSQNWKFENCYHAGQGTTSNEYGFAGRNIDVICCFDGVHAANDKIPVDENYITKLTLGDGTVIDDGTGKVALNSTSVPNNWFNIKVNVASSEMENNRLLQKRYNDYLPYTTPAKRRDSKIKNDMEFENCIVFIKESDPDSSTHREFNDNDWHFYAIGNIGDSKKTDYTRAYDQEDLAEFTVEISDNTLPNSTFDTGVYDTNGKTVYPISASQWVSGNPKYDSLYNNWDGSFEFRYDCCGDSKDGSAITKDDATLSAQRLTNKQIFRNVYKWIITSTDEEFVNELGDWFIEDSVLYWYLFTERYTMIDSRAKNTFWHWAKHYISETEAAAMGANKAKYFTIDNAKASKNNGYRFDFWDYDNDTALGINNSGELTLTYGKEDIDFKTDGVASSGYIYNAATSVFWCRVRDLTYAKRKLLYQTLPSNCWNAEHLIKEFDNAQVEFPEEIWRVAYERLYFRTYKAGTTRFLQEMMNGRKKYQRRQWERNQEIYMATKYLHTSITSDQIMFRCNTPVDAVVEPDYTLKIIPYSDMYLSVLYGNTSPTQIRAKAGVEYEITTDLDQMDDTAILIYAASRIQALNDLSACYIHDNDFSKATKIQKLVVGSNQEGYSNEFLTTLNIGNNPLLEYLDIRNNPNLTSTIDLSKCNNLKEFYASDTAIAGVIFANGGKLVTATLPSIISLTVKNLQYVEEIDIESYSNLQSLTIENTPLLNSYNIVNNSPKLKYVRLIGIDWDQSYLISDSTILNTILALKGIDNLGYVTDQSVLSGSVYVGSCRTKYLEMYNEAWSELDVSYGVLIEQFKVTFVNEDGTVLDVQYIDKGANAVDPITRENNPIDTPTKESTVSTYYVFDKWIGSFDGIFADRTLTASYTDHTRTYTIKYYSRGVKLQETDALYGTWVEYTGSTLPTYTEEEQYYKYYLFKDWDKSGYVDGDKTINATFDTFEYTNGAFDIEFSEMTPVMIYAMIKMGLNPKDYFEYGDSIGIDLGYDMNYSDVDCIDILDYMNDGNVIKLDGTKCYDTGIHLFDEDKDFTLAIDYTQMSDLIGGTITQCFDDDGANGFALNNNTTKVNPSDFTRSGGTESNFETDDKYIYLKYNGEDITTFYVDCTIPFTNKQIISFKSDITTSSNGFYFSYRLLDKLSGGSIIKEYEDLTIDTKEISIDLRSFSQTTLYLEFKFMPRGINSTFKFYDFSASSPNYNVQWGSTNQEITNELDYRTVIALRHKKGEQDLDVYYSNCYNSSTATTNWKKSAIRVPITKANLLLGGYSTLSGEDLNVTEKTELESPQVAYANQIRRYVGNTNDDYRKGVIYQCQSKVIKSLIAYPRDGGGSNNASYINNTDKVLSFNVKCTTIGSSGFTQELKVYVNGSMKARLSGGQSYSGTLNPGDKYYMETVNYVRGNADIIEYSWNEYGNIATNTNSIVHWCKLWYRALSDNQCINLVKCFHLNDFQMEIAHMDQYPSTVSGKKYPFTLIAKQLYGVKYKAGDEASDNIVKYLNSRLNTTTIPYTWQSLIHQSKVCYAVYDSGNITKTHIYYQYFFNPTAPELVGTSIFGYDEMTRSDFTEPISYMINSEARKKTIIDTEQEFSYWTRSFTTRVNRNNNYYVDTSGNVQMTDRNSIHGICLMCYLTTFI